MKLPQGDKVIIPKEKLLEYILSDTHAIGKFKARFFRKLGFSERNVEAFKRALHRIVKSEEVVDSVNTSYGIKYIIDGELATPSKKKAKVRTIWIIEKGENSPRFVTVYPV